MNISRQALPAIAFILSVSLGTIAAQPEGIQPVDYQRQTVYHFPQSPGYNLRRPFVG